MSNYTIVDLRMDYKKDTGKRVDESYGFGYSKDYVEYLENELIEYRDKWVKFLEFCQHADQELNNLGSMEIKLTEEQ